MIGGNCSEWYGGFDSYLVADVYDNRISMPKMRNTDFHDQLPRLSILIKITSEALSCLDVIII